MLSIALAALSVGAARARADGELDPAFGTGGSFELSLAPGSGAEGVSTILPLADARFLAIGQGEGNGSWITQHQANGSLDPDFGAGGGFHLHRSHYSFASAAAREADGAIVVAGAEQSGSAAYDTLVARVTPQGALDPSFGSDPPNPAGDGVSVFDLGGDDVAEDVTLDSAGRIVTAGRAGPPGSYDAKIVRFEPDGSIDPAFGGPEGVSTDLGGSDVAIAVASQGERIIAVVSSATKTYLVAYRPDGSLDPGFGGGDGIAPLGIPSEPESTGILVQPDGDIVVAASFESRVSIERMLPDGSPDTSFGNGGTAGFGAPGGVKGFYSSGIAEGDDGKIVVAASIFGSGKGGAYVLRLLADGQPDPAWGVGGVLAIPQPAGVEDSASAVAVLPGRRVLVGGEAYDEESGEANRLLVRLLGDTTPPDTAITHAPKRRLKRSAKKQSFRFEAVGDVNTTFECELARPRPKHKHRRRSHISAAAGFAPCASGVRYGSLRRPGGYRFAVRAIDPAGNVDATPAVAHFKVLPKKHRHHHRG